MMIRALLAFLALPGLFAIILPWILVSVDPWLQRGSIVGAAVMVGGLIVVVLCARDFYRKGKGTLAPWDPPQRLVVVGLYRYCRNPIYIGALSLVGGASLLAGSPLVAGYMIILAVFFHLRVVFNEERWLARQFPGEWQAYSDAVPRWVPRLRPWQGEDVGL
jgi:protein-S-isoprenylcysteine O-methyltransferase Ste14